MDAAAALPAAGALAVVRAVPDAAAVAAAELAAGAEAAARLNPAGARKTRSEGLVSDPASDWKNAFDPTAQRTHVRKR